MNKTALKTAFNSLSFRARLHGAMRKTAILKHNTAHVVNRKGGACLAVRWDAIKGFTFRDKAGKIIPNSTIYSFLRV